MNRRLLAAPLAVVLLAACSPEQTSTTAEATDYTVRIDVHGWLGYEATAAVMAYLLQHELGYKVVRRPVADEKKSWPGFENGQTDVIVENWGHDDLKKIYIEDKKVALSAGLNGNKGIIGWYVPQWMTEQYPGITDWRNLKKRAALFRTEKSGNFGQLLDGDPSFVTNDKALVTNLGLDFKVVYAGSEDALIKAAQDATKNRTPLLMYFYEPQWLFTKVKLAKVTLPPYAIGCDADAAKVACDYPPYLLDKVVSARFAREGGRAYELVRNFSWSNDHQNKVASDIVNGGMSADQAAKKWVEENKIVWKDWMPR
ncbi:MAG: ABC transporter substrate-binding protein [Thermoactinospora sp.]|nr:ABC transporter substrate-binding protein [Thermoactinospora sp.]